MIDIQALKDSIDLIVLAQAVTDLKQKGAKEWTGPCPFCGGRDRFNVQPEKWLCRHCTEGKWRDVIDFVMRRDNVNFKGAVKILGGDPGVSAARPRPKPSRAAYSPPADDWQASALEAIQQTRAKLASPAGERARRYLLGRGLKPETVERFSLGYSTGETIAGLYIPYGIVIPCVVRGEVWYLKIRTPNNEPGKKYAGVKGNRTNAIYNADALTTSEIALFCEGEFDCMLADQEAGDVITPVTLGAATNGPDLATWGAYLIRLRLALLAYDQDRAGERGAAAMADLLGGRAKYAPLPPIEGVKDITDFHLKGFNLWSDWLKSALDEWDPLPGDSLADYAKSVFFGKK